MEDTYIEFTSDGKIVVQNHHNDTHMFLTPSLRKRENLKFRDMEELFDFFRDQYKFGGWLKN